MARFLAIALLAPCLGVLAFLYWLYVRRFHSTRRLARQDVIIIVVAFVFAILGAAIAWQAAYGHAGPMWKFIAGPLGAYAGFNLILGYGLLWHWQRQRHPKPLGRP